MKLVMSTSALIGRRPIAVSRFCSQSGEGPFLTSLTRRRPKAGQSEGVAPKSSVTLTGQGNVPFSGLGGRSLKVPMEVAPRSRAMPLTPVQSGRLGVRLISVSYTHLRAHETGRNLVCRLLLEKKKKDKT